MPKIVYGGKNLTDIHRGTGLALSTICKIFNGTRGLSMNAALKISKYLGITVDQTISLVKDWAAAETQKRERYKKQEAAGSGANR